MEELRLRSYQALTIEATRDSMRKNKAVIVYSPQGSGKSVIAAFMAHNAARKKNKVLVLTHRQEILKQNFDKMRTLGIDVQIINALTRTIKHAAVYCAMSPTLVSRCKSKPEWAEWMQTVDFVIIDEAHRSDADTLHQYLRKDIWKIGLSASILRSGSMNQLGWIYQDIVNVVDTKELISLNFLTPSKNYAFQAPKIDDVQVNRGTGDYIQKQLEQRFRKPERYAGIIDNYNRICPGRKTLVFTTGTDHCIDLCIEFNKAGISARYLVSEARPETDNEYSGERVQLLRDFERGVFDVLVNISILDVGYDCPPLEAVILDFSTKSYAKYTQAVGRGGRVYKGKECFFVLDFGANISSFGIYEDKPLMSLWHNPGGTGVPMTKVCPEDKPDPSGKMGCNRLVPISAQDCPFCGWHFSTETEIYHVELQEVIEREKEDMMSIPGYVAAMILKGKTANQILMAVCIKNPEAPKKAFLEAIKHIRTKEGKPMSEKYWYFFKTQVLRDRIKK